MQSSKALMLIKQVKNPTLIGDVNTHILYFYKYFFPFAQNKRAGHAASEPRRRTSHYEDRH